jgi:enolase
MHGLPMILLDYRGKHTKNQPRIGAAALLSVKMSSVRAAIAIPPGNTRRPAA